MLDKEKGIDVLSKTDSAGDIVQDGATADAGNSRNFETSPSGFHGSPIFIEACAGCGILSSVMQQRGFQVIPIDCPRNRHTPKCRLVVMDLTAPHADQLLRRIVDDYRVAGVHIALPCGTCSKARGIPLPNGAPGPPPLRDMEHLHGLPGLSAMHQAKIDAANQLYKWADEFIRFLISRSVPWTIENPSNSWLWEMPYAIAHGHFVHLHACAYGGERKKKTSFLCSEAEFMVLEKFCDGTHPHKEWGFDFEKGEFNTAKEAEYPKALCEQYANVLERLTLGFNEQRATVDKPEKVKPQQQAKGRSLPQIIPEFAAVRTVTSKELPPVNDKKVLTAIWQSIPAGSKLLRTEAKRGDFILYVFGLFRGMEDFVKVARQLWHPFDELRNLPDCMVQCIFRCLKSSPAEMTRRRIQTLRLWSNWEKELRKDELELHRSLHPKVANVLAGKRLLLFEKLATSIGWPDKGLHLELKEGFKLTGYLPPSGVFKTEVRPAAFGKQELMQDSKFLRPLLLGKVRSAGNTDQYASELFDITVKEAVDKNWLEGPFDVADIDNMFDCWLPVRRFAVFQRGKVRPIDDMKENKLNQSFSCGEKIDLQALDQLVWSLQVITRFCLHGGDLDFVLSDGERLRAPVHQAWKGVDAKLTTTAFDLESAYKQLALHPSEYDCTVVTLRNPSSNKPACFLMRTLPFGSTASVLHFNRVARLIWRLGVELDLWWSNYFDDFPCISHCCQLASTKSSVECLFKLLGFRFAHDKLAPFAERSEMLGVILDTSKQGCIVIDNKDTRKAELAAEITKILESGSMDVDTLPSVLGRVQFAEMRISGRQGKLALADIREWERSTKIQKQMVLDPVSMDAFKTLHARVTSGKPQQLFADVPERPVIIFTDGAVETNSDGNVEATIGGVLICDNVVQMFGTRVDDDVLKDWLTELTHPVGLTEMYAIVVALNLWKEKIAGRRVICFCDNWTAIDVFVKGSSPIRWWRRLLLALEKIDENLNCLMWMARVASPSNVADPPSRGQWDQVDFMKPFDVRHPRCPITGKTLRGL